MSEVVGSKQYRSIVVRDEPKRRGWLLLLILVLLAIVATTAYWLGGNALRSENQRLLLDYKQVAERVAGLEAVHQEVSQQLTNITVGSEIDQQAAADLRGLVGRHKQKIIELNEEISFYKGLMAPTEREQGLSIRSWEVYATSNPNRMQYKLIMQQLAIKHTVLKGGVEVKLVGKLWGQPHSYYLDKLSQQLDSQDVKLRFKYYQSIDGELELPKGFVPERVDIVASASTPKKVKVEKHYSWSVQS
jgi:hypothetical protein